MREVSKYLTENPIVYVASCDNGQPRVRPFQFMFEREGRIYFCTGESKDVCKQLRANPRTELSVMAADGSWMRVSGSVVFADDRALKQEVLDKSELVKSIYKTADNPEFSLFYLDEVRAGIYDFSGKPPRMFG